MTAPRITRTGTCRAAGREVDIVGLDALCVALVATPDETEDARALAEAGHVRVTIEPADVVSEPAPHGTALDYLSEMKGIMQGALDGFAISEQTERALLRCMSLANSVSLAILAERRGRP